MRPPSALSATSSAALCTMLATCPPRTTNTRPPERSLRTARVCPSALDAAPRSVAPSASTRRNRGQKPARGSLRQAEQGEATLDLTLTVQQIEVIPLRAPEVEALDGEAVPGRRRRVREVMAHALAPAHGPRRHVEGVQVVVPRHR